MSFRDEMASAFKAVNISNVGDGEATPTPTSTSRTLTFGGTPGESNVISLGGEVASPRTLVCLVLQGLIRSTM